MYSCWTAGWNGRAVQLYIRARLIGAQSLHHRAHATHQLQQRNGQQNEWATANSAQSLNEFLNDVSIKITSFFVLLSLMNAHKKITQNSSDKKKKRTPLTENTLECTKYAIKSVKSRSEQKNKTSPLSLSCSSLVHFIHSLGYYEWQQCQPDASISVGWLTRKKKKTGQRQRPHSQQRVSS